jgi:flagellar biogenesis protein FliO
MQDFGKLILLIGIILAVLGLMLWQFSGKLGWFGNLPGDIRIEKQNFRIYIPLTSMLLISLLITFMVWLYRKLQ